MSAVNGALMVMIAGCWVLMLPKRLRRWWTNEGGAVLIVAGLIFLLIMAAQKA